MVSPLLVEKGYQHGDKILIDSIPQALGEFCLRFRLTIGSTKSWDQYGRCCTLLVVLLKKTAEASDLGCAEADYFCQCGGRQSFHAAGAFHGLEKLIVSILMSW